MCIYSNYSLVKTLAYTLFTWHSLLDTDILKINCYITFWSASVQYMIYLARKADIGQNSSRAQFRLSLANKLNIGKADDKTTLLLFQARKYLNF